MLKEIVIAIQSYLRAHRFIQKYKLWRWIILPGILYMALFITGFYFFWTSSGSAISWATQQIGLDSWVAKQKSGLLSFFFVMGEIMLRLVLALFYYSLFKMLFLILGSPLFAYLSEKTAAIIEGKDYPFSFAQFLKDILRGIRLALRNALWQIVFTLFIIILAFFPIVGWIAPVIAIFIECYYYGFAMIDYSCERNQLSPSESMRFIANHKGLAIGNGIVFYGFHLIPVLGWILAPSYAVIAATISIHQAEKHGSI